MLIICERGWWESLFSFFFLSFSLSNIGIQIQAKHQARTT